ncbi:hypothetical protein [Gordoniibacillus kamchatkensis]|uniref:hypothetical protein n=1 Tax=Gordoniibacillus kamchatkensis TaxID=1590651 RepID=UPI0012E0724A|nr:hypothetical protein [Paenibacillus sp. VKM B-2647]
MAEQNREQHNGYSMSDEDYRQAVRNFAAAGANAGAGPAAEQYPAAGTDAAADEPESFV